MRPMRPEDWETTPIEVGRYSNDRPLAGFQRADGLGGNPLSPAEPGERFEESLSAALAALCARYPHVRAARYFLRMPYWHGVSVPPPADYAFVPAPEPLVTTSVTVLTVPRTELRSAHAGYHYRARTLPTLRQRLAQRSFRGLIGNLGFYMTEGLIGHKFPWSHGRRYPAYPLPPMPAYLGFHMHRDAESGEVWGSLPGAHPGALGIRIDGTVDLIPHLGIARVDVVLPGVRMRVDAIDDPLAVDADVAAYTPACRTPEIDALIAEVEGQREGAERWQHYAPTVPLPDARDRVHLFVANQGDGRHAVAYIAAVWEGAAPLPSFGAVLSVKRAHFQKLLGAPAAFAERHVGVPLQIVPVGDTPFHEYATLLGGLVPAVVDGAHICTADNVPECLRQLTEHGNAISPIAQASKESRNYHPHVREPAGLVVQTARSLGWVLLDGRHEHTIGASAIDACQILRQLEQHGAFDGPLTQALFIDGGSGLKVYDVQSDGAQTELRLLNRVAAGARNGPGRDPDGLNLYSTLALAL
ncbi:MAG: hypothetical protein JXA09_16155 [Anaerolineae bacterium]|nr:hypothetical protein [Anaerolineae bacterium]